jgi:hypothetical protein
MVSSGGLFQHDNRQSGSRKGVKFLSEWTIISLQRTLLHGIPVHPWHSISNAFNEQIVMNIYIENLIKQKPDVVDNIVVPARIKQ